MPLNLFYTMVQKSQKWPKTQIKGGPTLSTSSQYHIYDCDAVASILIRQREGRENGTKLPSALRCSFHILALNYTSYA